MLKKFIFPFFVFLSFASLIFARVYAPNLPGINDKLNTEKIIRELLEVKKMPIKKKENNIKDLEIENGILSDYKKYLNTLNSKTKELYGLKSPFKEMKAKSSDPNYLGATASRKAQKQEYKIQIIQKASADAFMSDSIPRNKIFKQATFSIKIGENKYTIHFRGGTISQLAQSIQDQADEDIETRVINDTATTSVLQITGKKTGKKNKMFFSGDLSVFFQTGLLTKNSGKDITIKPDLSLTVSVSSNRVIGTPQSLILPALSKAYLDTSAQHILVSNTTILSFNAEMIKQASVVKQNLPEPAIPKLKIGQMEDISVSNVVVKGAGLIPFYEKKKNIQAQTTVTNFRQIITIVFDDNSKRSLSIVSNGNTSVSLGTDMGKRVVRIIFENRNTDRQYQIKNMKFRTGVEEKGIVPARATAHAADAIITLDGIRVDRNKNEISDVISGVVLYLKQASKKEITLNIDHDYKLVMDSITDWVNSYNQVMEYTSILTKPDLDKTPLHERPKKTQKNGLYQTEFTLTSLHNKLRMALMNNYPTRYGRELSLLEQIGIFTKKAGPIDTSSDVWESTRMGLMNVDTDKLKNMLTTRFEGVKQLFIHLVNGSFTGIAWNTAQTLHLVLGITGFVSSRIKENERKVKRIKSTIQKMNSELGDYELQLRKKYGRMNEVIRQTEAEKKSWENFNPPK